MVAAEPEGPLVLVVVDGLGLRSCREGNAVAEARIPTLCRLRRDGLFTRLQASGEAVGQAAGQMGNSNVGHLHLGAGRIVPQAAVSIDRAIDDGSFFQKGAFLRLFGRMRSCEATLHLMGLLSDGGVHSHIDHLLSLVDMAADCGVHRLAVHAFLDGRDVPPRSAGQYIDMLQRLLEEYPGFRIATVCGRYWAMDRDNRWQRTDRALAAMLRAEADRAADAESALQRAYERGEDDEFVRPTVTGEYPGCLPDDGFLFVNFRADRARQLSRALLHPGDVPADSSPLEKPADLVTMTRYDKEFDNPVAFEWPDLSDTLGEVISRHSCWQLRVAETEKYAHVTYFLNGGRESPFFREERIMVPSPAVATYDQRPQMSAQKVTEKTIRRLADGDFRFAVVNYANLDMVGHTGDFAAAVAAVEAVDSCLGQLAEAVLGVRGVLLVVGDHGNAEQMTDSEGQPHTAHTSNPVPCILLGGPYRRSGRFTLRKGGGLADVAVTVLNILRLPVPQVMSGDSLLQPEGSLHKQASAEGRGADL